MIGGILEAIIGFLPTWAWVVVGIGIGVTAWEVGDDDNWNSDQGSIDRLLSGLSSIVYGVLKTGGRIVWFVGREFAGLLQRGGAALKRLGRWAEENVSIEIVLGGRFWLLIIMLVLIATGYRTLSALQL